jgi:L-ascorbate metabolism protein UlaG (beta-lactamase superfamily)
MLYGGVVLATFAGTTPGAAQDEETQAAAQAPSITYIGNAGVFIQYASHGVLIDALVRRGIPPYITAPADVREEIEQAEPPFDRVDLVLATHYHADHFDASAVWRHLDHNANAVFVSAPQAAAQVIATPLSAQLEERVIPSDPSEGTRERLSFAGIEFDVLNLHHGRERRPSVANVGFVIDIEGFRVLHVGDTEVDVDELMSYALVEDSIHVALVPYWHLASESGKRIVDVAIKPRVLVAIHIPGTSAAPSYFAPERTLDALVTRLERDYPGIVVFREPLQRIDVTVGGP